MYNQKENCSCETKNVNTDPGIAGIEKTRVGRDVMDYLKYISENSELVANLTENRLIPVMSQGYPKAVTEKGEGEIPPFFSEMKSYIRNIDRSLERIKEYLERTEI